MPLHIDEYRDIIDGSGRNNITPAIEEAIKIAKEDNVRVRIYIRVKDTGTPTMRKVNEARFDPNVTSVENVKQILIQKLEDSPGPEFSGTVKIEFLDNSNSNYLSGYQRNVRIGTVAQYDPNSEVVDDYNDVSMIEEEVDEERRDEYVSLLKSQLQAKDRDIAQQRAFVDASMGFMFKSQAQMQAMFERACRMMENYTLRFGFPHNSIPGVTEIHGSGNSEPVPPPALQGGGGGGNMGILPMLIKMAGQLAQGEAQPAPAQNPPAIAQRPQRSRMQSVVEGSQDVRYMRGGVPQYAEPMEGAIPAPPLPDENDHPMTPSHDPYTNQLMTSRPQHQDGYDDEEDDSYEDGDGYDDEYDDDQSNALNQFNSMDAESMKQLVLGWVKASPENRAAAMDMGTDLVSEIMKGE
jgi:hypothetical protein